MARPVLIDTDMGVDDAVAITLALGSSEIEVAGLASVGGNVPIDQATANIGRLLEALGWPRRPEVARGYDQERKDLPDATHVFAADGLGGLDLSVPAGFSPGPVRDLYEQLIESHGSDLAIVALGPLTNLFAVMRDCPGLLARAGQVVVMGGAVWCPGNVTAHAEFNFYRDPQAAEAVLSSGLPITIVPLDVTRQVAMDESHLAHLSCSGTRSGELLSQMIRFPLEKETAGAAPGTFLVHDAVAIGVLLWPQLFIRSKMVLDMVTSGKQMGRCKPAMVKDQSRKVGVVMSVNVGEFLANLVERVCQERFVV